MKNKFIAPIIACFALILHAAEFDIVLSQENSGGTYTRRTISPTGTGIMGFDASKLPVFMSPGTDYEVPLTFSTGLTRSTNTVTVNTTQNIAKLSNLTSNGFVKTSGSDGTLSVDTNSYLTGNQTITLSGDVSGSGATSITTAIGNNKVTGAMIALGSDAQGDIMYYNGTDWVRLAAGTSGQFLKTLGAGANPAWDSPAGSGDVIGPATNTNGFVPKWNGANSKTLADGYGVSSGGAGAADSGKLNTFMTGGELVATRYILVTETTKGTYWSEDGWQYGVGGKTLTMTFPNTLGGNRTVSWQDASGTVMYTADTATTSNAIQSATTTVNTSSATAPSSGQVLTATGSTAATWQTPALKAWVHFDGSTADNVSGTYSRTGTTVTVTLTSHGYIVGNVVYLDFTSGTATDGLFTITGITDANNFTVTHGTSGSTSGNVTLLRRQIKASSGVHSVTYNNAAGRYYINFSTAMSDAFYVMNGTAGQSAAGRFVFPYSVAAPTAQCAEITVVNSAALATAVDATYVMLSFFR